MKRETSEAIAEVTTVPAGYKLIHTSLYHANLINKAPKEAVRAIIPQKTGVNSLRTLYVLLSLYFKPSTRKGVIMDLNTETNSVDRRIDYLIELGYLSEDRYYWLSAAMSGYRSAVRYSVNLKGEQALQKFLSMLEVK